MTQHTPEPWVRGERLLDIVSSKGNLVARLAGTAGKCEVEDANLRRIVACVNACAGWETNQLEVMELGSLKESLVRVMQQRDDLQAQVDELLKALRIARESMLRARSVMCKYDDTPMSQEMEIITIDHVIKKITGEPK